MTHLKVKIYCKSVGGGRIEQRNIKNERFENPTDLPGVVNSIYSRILESTGCEIVLRKIA